MTINANGYEVDSSQATAIEKIVDNKLVSSGINIAPGGSAGQVYTKASNTDFDGFWRDPAASSAGTPGQIDGGAASTNFGSTTAIDGGGAI